MPKYLVVADAAWARNEVHAALTDPDATLIDHDDPATAADAAVDHGVDAVIADLQMKAMGGMAVTRAVREATGSEEDAGIPVVLLLDRSADAFLARRAGAVAWVVKPFTTHDLGNALAVALVDDAADDAEGDTPQENEDEDAAAAPGDSTEDDKAEPAAPDTDAETNV